jgi:hypothetical protein
MTSNFDEPVHRLSSLAQHPLCMQWGLSRRQLERAVHRGDLIAHKPALHVMVRESALLDYIEGSRIRPGNPRAE